MGCLDQQMDFVLFVYGLGFILLGTVCFALLKDKDTRLPWQWLGLFGVLHGVHKWLQLPTFSLGDNQILAAIRFCLMVLSSVALLEFGRVGMIRLTGRGPERWILLIPLAIYSAALPFGLEAVNNTATHVLALVGGLWSSAVLYRASRACQGRSGRTLLLAGVSIGLYGLFSALVKSQTPFLAETLSSEWVTNSAATATELATGLLAALTATAIYVYFESSCRLPAQRAVRARMGEWAAILLPLILLCGWLLTSAAGEDADKQFRQNLLSRTTAAASAIDPSIVTMLAGSPSDAEEMSYKHVQYSLRSIKGGNPDTRYVYLMRMKHGRIIFLADAEPLESADSSAPGDVYDEATPELLTIFTDGTPIVEGPTADSWGTWVSGLAPIRNPQTGRTLAILGMDVDAQMWDRAVRLARLFCIIITMLVCAVVTAFLFILGTAKESEAVIANSELRYRSLVDGSPNCVALLDKEGRYITVNRNGSSLMGCQESDLIGRRFADIWPQERRSMVQRTVEQVLQGGECSFEGEYVRQDGRVVCWQVALSPVIGKNDAIDQFIAICIDITARKTTEKELRKTTSELQAIIHAFPDIYVRLSSDGTVLDCSVGRESDLREPAGELIGKQLQKILPDELAKQAEDAICKVRTTRSLVTVECGLHLNGEPRNYEARFVPVFEDQIFVVARNITDRKNAEEQLRCSEARYRLLADNVTDVIWTVNLNLKFTYFSPSITRLTGYDAEEAMALSFDDLLTPEACSLTLSVLEEEVIIENTEGAAPHRSRLLELEIKRKDGTTVWTETEAIFLRSSDGSPIGILGVARDITERRRTEKTLRASEANYRAIFDAANDAIFVHDLETGRVIDVNKKMCEMFGYSEEEAKNLPARLTSAGEGLFTEDNALRLLKQAVEGQPQLIEWRAKHRDGHLFWVEVNLRRATIGGQDRVLAIVRDITGRKVAEASLRIQTSAINAASDQIVITDAEGKIVFVNPAFERETGYRFDEAVGQSSRILSSGKHDPAFYTEMWNKILAGGTWHGEIINRHRDGTLCTEDVTITPIRNEKGDIEHFVAIKRNVTEKKRYQEQLDHLAHHDALTSLPNRLLFSDRLTSSLSKARRAKKMLAVMFLDLDRFKLINDSLGHSMGDLLLKRVAERLTWSIREADTIARMGGDEFTVIVDDIATSDDAATLAQRILEALSQPFQFDNGELFVTASIGISIFPADGTDAETLVRNADIAMYRAKDQGCNTFCLFTDSLNTAALEQMTLESNLRKALEREELVVYYQPRVDIKTGRIMAAEALVRWQHPQLGLIFPGQFIPLAEETGLIVPMGEWVLDTACRQTRAWSDAGLPEIDVAVNVSAYQFQREDLRPTVRKVLSETGLEPHRLDLELTESTLVHNSDVAANILAKMKGMGLKLSIDDFGTGYSSLSYLKKFPVDAVKIDQSFIRNVTADSDDAAIASAIVGMAHKLNLKVIAEGVETLEQLEFLRSINCDEMQGYFVSKPVPGEEFAELLKDSCRPDSSDDLQAA